MKGSAGVATGGNSRKAALKRNLQYLIKARDLVCIHERGRRVLGDDVLDVCCIALTQPSNLSSNQTRMIWAIWQDVAEGGGDELRGIRKDAHIYIDLFLENKEVTP